MGRSVSSGAHSGFVGVCSKPDELLSSLTLDSTSLDPEGDEGRRDAADSFSLAGDP